MSNVGTLKVLVPTSAITGGSLFARELSQTFTTQWWAVFVIVSVSLWIITHIAIAKYISSARR